MYYQLPFKTGRYVVESLGEHPGGTLVQVLAVIHHPKQGDLHAPGETDVFFHERKALAFKEKRVVSPNLLKPHNEDVQEYAASLKDATCRLEEKLKQEESAYNLKALETLNEIKEEYTRYYNIQF